MEIGRPEVVVSVRVAMVMVVMMRMAVIVMMICTQQPGASKIYREA